MRVCLSPRLRDHRLGVDLRLRQFLFGGLHLLLGYLLGFDCLLIFSGEIKVDDIKVFDNNKVWLQLFGQLAFRQKTDFVALGDQFFRGKLGCDCLESVLYRRSHDDIGIICADILEDFLCPRAVQMVVDSDE